MSNRDEVIKFCSFILRCDSKSYVDGLIESIESKHGNIEKLSHKKLEKALLKYYNGILGEIMDKL